MEFWTTLIREKKPRHSHKALASLEANCTHVTGDYWIMEGDVETLRDEGVRFEEVAQGAVQSLGDLTEDELKEICLDAYGVKL
jgi:hypothetical protein